LNIFIIINFNTNELILTMFINNNNYEYIQKIVNYFFNICSSEIIYFLVKKKFKKK
jgi:hypothetical protein